jgi:hypothetical protein
MVSCNLVLSPNCSWSFAVSRCIFSAKGSSSSSVASTPTYLPGVVKTGPHYVLAGELFVQSIQNSLRLFEGPLGSCRLLIFIRELLGPFAACFFRSYAPLAPVVIAKTRCEIL